MDASIALEQGTIDYRERRRGRAAGVRARPARRRAPVARRRAARWPSGTAASSPTGRWARTARALAPGADRSPRGHRPPDRRLPRRAASSSDVTIVANDTGGAISQILAAERPQRLRRARADQLRLPGELPAAGASPAAVARARAGRLLAARAGQRARRALRRSRAGLRHAQPHAAARRADRRLAGAAARAATCAPMSSRR